MARLTCVGIFLIFCAFSKCYADGFADLPEMGPLSSKEGLSAMLISSTSKSIVTPAPPVNTTTQHTTKATNQTTANSTVTPAPPVNTTTLHTTKATNHTTANSTVTPAPPVNTTTPHTTKATNHTTANSTVTPAPPVNTTTPHTTKATNHTTANSTVTTAPPVNTTTPHTTKPSNHTTTLPANSTTHTVHTTTVVPTFAPTPSPPAIGNYSVSDKGANCIMALMGLELMFHNLSKDSYFNIDPSQTHTSGNCGKSNSNLNLTFSNGFINFNFVKNDSSYFVDQIEALFHPLNLQKTTKQNLFRTEVGSSYKCSHTEKVALGGNVTLLLVKVHLQAFEIKENKFGAVSQCSADFNSRIALAVGLAVVILVILSVIIYFIYRRQKSSGYQRI